MGRLRGARGGGLGPCLDPASARMEGCRAAPFTSPGLLGALEVMRGGLHEGRGTGAWGRQRCWVFASLPCVRTWKPFLSWHAYKHLG